MVSVVQREWAGKNPRATFKEPITVADVLKSRMIAYPFRILMCCLVTDGGGALILTSAERAKDFPTKPVYILGTGESVESPMISQMEDFTSSRAFRVAGKKAFDEAGIAHKDVDHLMIYDAFAHLPLYGLEDLGFCKPGEAAAFIGERNTAPGGKLPLNTNGGGLSYMHSGMYGMYALQESVRQMRGIAPGAGAGRKGLRGARRRRHVRGKRHHHLQQRAALREICSHELRRTVRRAQGGRPQPGRGGPLLRHAARPARRRRHQGRADRRRRLGAHHRQALRHPHRLFDPDELRQALHRARPEVGGGQGRAVAADRRRRRAARGLPPRRARPARLRLRRGVGARAAHPLCLGFGLRPDRARSPTGRPWTPCCRRSPA